MTQQSVSECANITKSTYVRIETGETRSPQPHTVKAIATALCVDVAQLLSPQPFRSAPVDASPHNYRDQIENSREAKLVRDRFRVEATNTFGDRIRWAGFYGSRAFLRSSDNSDYDFYVLLDSEGERDQEQLRRLGGATTIDLTFQYQNELAIVGWQNYRLLNHGSFYILNWATSITIIGDNPFERIAMELPDMPRRHVNLLKLDIRNQTHEHFDRVRHRYIKDDDLESLITFYRKYLIRVVTNVLLFHGAITYRDIHYSSYNNVVSRAVQTSHFSERSRAILWELFIEDDARASNAPSEKVPIYHKLMRSLAVDRLRLYAQGNGVDVDD